MSLSFPPISPRELEALQDLAEWGGPYRFRQASMRRLAAKGYVERHRSSSEKSPHWILTDLGKERMKRFLRARGLVSP